MKEEDVLFLGRDELVESVLDVICADMDNNNVILWGDSGIGKTQMARYLAMKIGKGDFPELKGYRVFLTSAKHIISNASFVGMKQGRVLELFEYLNSIGNVVLFIDEIWQLVGTGLSVGGTTDIAGAYLKRNRAFLDRFQIIEVPPMTPQERVEIMKAHIARYREKGLEIPDTFAQIISGINLRKGITSLRSDIKLLGIIASRMRRKNLSAVQAVFALGY